MKVILSEEQIKHLFSGHIVSEAVTSSATPSATTASTSQANTDTATGAATSYTQAQDSEEAQAADPIKRFNKATGKINSYVSAVSGGFYDNGEDNEDPMPYGPMAYADQKRMEYNSSIGIDQGWLRVVQQTYNDFKGPLFHSQYNQRGFKKYNGSTARADCTGFICAALRNAGYKVPNNNSRGMVGGNAFTSQINGGFTRVSWNKNAYGTINGKPLPAGTILAYPGHGMIVGEYNPSTKKLKGYDYGHNKHDENNPVNMKKIYTVAWIPKGDGNA